MLATGISLFSTPSAAAHPVFEKNIYCFKS